MSLETHIVLEFHVDILTYPQNNTRVINMAAKPSRTERFLKAPFRLTRSFVEQLNLKTNHHLKQEAITILPDDKLIALKSAARRAVASTSTGVAANTTISFVSPVFVGALLLSGHQLGVSATNLLRARREYKRRMQTDPNFRGLAKELENPLFVDITVAITLKLALTFVALGVVGFDHVVDGLVTLAQTHSFTETGLVDQVAGHAQNALQAAHGGGEALYDAFQIAHPDGAQIDGAVHNLLNYTGDEAAEGLQGTFTDGTYAIGSETTWGHLLGYVGQEQILGHSGFAVVEQGAFVGVTAALADPLQVVEMGIDEAMRRERVNDVQGGVEKHESKLSGDEEEDLVFQRTLLRTATGLTIIHGELRPRLPPRP